MPKPTTHRSHKAFVRKHQSSYWSVRFSKPSPKKKDDTKGKESDPYDDRSVQVNQGSQHGGREEAQDDHYGGDDEHGM
jgi:hypothetical protein